MLIPAHQDDTSRDLDMAARCRQSWAEYEAAAAATAAVCQQSWAEYEAIAGLAAERGRPQT
jgi:hypothetical protein